MVNLPADITTNILSRLPVNSLLRFRCVSKHWCTLIDGPYFIKLHLKRSTNPSLILSGSYLHSVDLDTLDRIVQLDNPLKTPPYRGTQVVGSCNGLLCLFDSRSDFILWNPSTRTHQELPPYVYDHQWSILGFWYDDVHDDYKVVQIVPLFKLCKIYSLRSNSWRRIQYCPYRFRHKQQCAAFASGALHWLASREPESDNMNDHFIVALDVGVEEYRIVPLPHDDFSDNANFDMDVHVLGGCLCLRRRHINVCVDFWIMKDYGVKESWAKLFSFALEGEAEDVTPLAYSKSGGEILLWQQSQNTDALIWYDSKSRNHMSRGLPYRFDLKIFVPSLVRLNGTTDSVTVGKKQQYSPNKMKNKKDRTKRKRKRKKRGDFRAEGCNVVLNFSTEVIANILSRLPIKSLLRFKSVSKSWCTLISNPDFVKRHIKQSIESNININLILRGFDYYSVDFDSLNNVVEVELPIETSSVRTEVVGSCNGLLCLYRPEENVALWNLSTGKCCKLPMTLIELPRYSTIYRRSIYGFGYDFINDEYKVVRIAQYAFHTDADSEVKVYSPKTNSWRRIQDFPYYLRTNAWGMFAGGALHWVARTRTPKSNINLVIAFDLGVEEYREVPQPNFLDRNFNMDVGVLGGCLCIIATYPAVRTHDIWVMKDYGVKESWTKLFSLAQSKETWPYSEHVTPLAYSKSGDEVLLELGNKKLVWYDLKKNEVKDVKIRGMPNFFKVMIFIGSLVSLNRDSGIHGNKQQIKAEDKMKKR